MGNQRKIGVLLSYVSQFVHIAVNLIYTPIMLRLVGQSEYGLYQLVYSVVSYLSLLSFGFSAAYIRFYSRYNSKNDRQSIASLNGMFLTIFTGIAVIALVGGIVLLCNIDLVLGEKLTAEEMQTARTLMALMVFNLVLTFPSSVFSCYVTSQECFIFQKLIIIAKGLLSPIVTLPFLIFGYGSVAMISVSTVLTAVEFGVNVYYCIVRLKMQFCFSDFNFSLLREMWKYTFFIFLGQIIDQVNWSVDKFLLGRYMGTIAVAVYGLASTVNNMYLQMSITVSNVFVPKIHALVAKENDNDVLTDLFIKVGRVQFFVLALVLIGFISIGRPFMRLWGGGEYAQSYYVALFLIVPVTIPLIQNLGIEIQRAKNLHHIRSIVYLVISICNILLSIPLIQRFGEVGAAAGTASALLIGNGVFMNWYYQKKIGLNIIRFWREIFSILPALLLPGFVGAVIFKYAQIDSWRQLIMYGMLIVVTYGISVSLWGFNDYEKGLIRSMAVRRNRQKDTSIIRRRGKE